MATPNLGIAGGGDDYQGQKVKLDADNQNLSSFQVSHLNKAKQDEP